MQVLVLLPIDGGGGGASDSGGGGGECLSRNRQPTANRTFCSRLEDRRGGGGECAKQC